MLSGLPNVPLPMHHGQTRHFPGAAAAYSPLDRRAYDRGDPRSAEQVSPWLALANLLEARIRQGGVGAGGFIGGSSLGRAGRQGGGLPSRRSIYGSGPKSF